MTRDEVQRQTECIARLASQLSKQPRLQAEVQRARRQFFGDDLRGAGNDAAEHRFAEWFLIERESESLGAIPITVPPYVQDVDPLEGSIAGLFLVESVGSTVTAVDMQNDEAVELAEAGSLQVGDLLVGRLYPVSGERWAASAATPALRPGRELATAFVRDLKKLDLDRRLMQIELEHLLLSKHGGATAHVGLDSASDQSTSGSADAAAEAAGLVPAPDTPLEHLEADLEQLLLSAKSDHSATAISEQLAETAHPGQIMGPLLDQLAFDTDIDLDRTRRVLLEIWNAHHAGEAVAGTEPSSSGPPGETLGEQLVRRLDEGIGEHEDVEEVFKQMERIAGIEPDEEEVDEEDDERNSKIVAEVFETGGDDGDSGDLAPLVTEYHWEKGTEQPEQSALTLWIELQRSAAVPNTDVEGIPAGDLMRLLLHVYLRSAPEERVTQVRGAFEELRLFYDWIVETQEIDQREIVQSCKGALLDQLERLQAAGVALSNDQAPAQSPGLIQIEEVGKDGFGARDDDGGSHWILCDEAALPMLEVGDIVLAGFAPPAGDEPTSLHRRLAGMVVVLPIDARSLIE